MKIAINERTLYRICECLALTPSQLVEEAREDIREFENVVFDYVTKREREGKRAPYMILVGFIVPSLIVSSTSM